MSVSPFEVSPFPISVRGDHSTTGDVSACTFVDIMQAAYYTYVRMYIGTHVHISNMYVRTYALCLRIYVHDQPMA